MPKITVDGQTIDCKDRQMVLQACSDAGMAIPQYCYHPGLSIVASCRICLVEVEGIPKMVPACQTPVRDGMVVNSKSPKAVANQKQVMEYLLINHPLDCPVCDQAGECDLQNLAYEHGASTTRYEEDRRTFEKIDIGDKIQLHMTRCILCYRCTYVADQLTNDRVHGILGRGDKSEISTYIQKAVDNDFSGNMIDVCPVGALTDKTFRFKSRVWFTNPLDAHRDCTTRLPGGQECTGKVVLWMKGDEVLRVSARKDQYGEVKEYICNECRFEHKTKNDWTVEGPRHIDRGSVIAQNHYEKIDLQKLKKEVERQLEFQKGRPLPEIS